MIKLFKPNFNADCNKKFNQYGGIVFKKAIELFTYLPIATIVSNKAGVRCFVVHGGVSNRIDLNSVCGSSDLNRYEFETVKIDQSVKVITSNSSNNTNTINSIGNNTSSSRPSVEQAIKNNKENDSIVNDYTSSYIALPPNLKFEKPLVEN